MDSKEDKLGEKSVQYSARCCHDYNGFRFEVFDIENSAENRAHIVKDLERVAENLLKTHEFYEYALHLTIENKIRLARN